MVIDTRERCGDLCHHYRDRIVAKYFCYFLGCFVNHFIEIWRKGTFVGQSLLWETHDKAFVVCKNNLCRVHLAHGK